MYLTAGVKFGKEAEHKQLDFLNILHADDLIVNGRNAGFSNFFILKTCNRFELYCQAADIHSLCNLFFGEAQARIFLSQAKAHYGIDAAKHLYQVASGLDSRLLGDYEISAQVRDAAKLSKKSEVLGSYWELLVNNALAVSKEIKTHTGICKGFVSYASVALNEAMLHFGSLADKKVVLYGLGKIGKNLLEFMMKVSDVKNVVLVNRTAEKAAALAAEFSISFAPESDLRTVLKDADIVFVCTGADEYVLTESVLQGSSVSWIADLSLPDNVDPSLQNASRKVMNLEEMTVLFEKNLDERKKELPAALQIVDHHLGELKKKLRLKKYMRQLTSWNDLAYASAGLSGKEFVETFMKRMGPLVQKEKDNACTFLHVMNEIGRENLN